MWYQPLPVRLIGLAEEVADSWGIFQKPEQCKETRRRYYWEKFFHGSLTLRKSWEWDCFLF